MRQTIPVACALVLGLAASAGAQTVERQTWTEGTPVVVVGRVTSKPKTLLNIAHEHKMQVGVGPRRTDYTLHLSDAKIFDQAGREMAISDLRSDWWVRAEGTVMDDPKRIKVSRLEVAGADAPGFAKSQFYRSGFEQGYVMRAENRPVAGGTAGRFAEGTPVVVVGEVTSQPRDAGIVVENKMQVGIGPEKTDYTLHLGDAKLSGIHGEEIGKSGLKDRMWVRAEGTVMDDPRRIKASRLQVVGKDLPGLKQSAFYRPGFDQGYVLSVAGSREVFPRVADTRFAAAPVTLVGRISDDTGPFNATRKIQVKSAGNEWTMRVVDGATVVDERGKQVSVHDLKDGQWIRATGWQTDDLRMRVFRMEALGAPEAFERSTYYRKDSPFGYVERVTIVGFEPQSFSGTITGINEDFGYVTVRDENGRERRVYTDLADLRAGDRGVTLSDVRIGDRISVRGPVVDIPASGFDRGEK